MGVEYRRYVIPRPNSHLPTAAQIAELVGALVAGRWIPAGATAGMARSATREGPLDEPLAPWLEAMMQRDFELRWEVQGITASGVRFPLVASPVEPDESYFDLKIQVCKDYVYRTSECIEPFDDRLLRCSCGEPLEYDSVGDLFYAQRIRWYCPRDGAPIDVSALPAVAVDGWTGERRQGMGGATSRFAIVADCGKCWAQSAVERLLDPALLQVCRDALEMEVYDLEDWY